MLTANELALDKVRRCVHPGSPCTRSHVALMNSQLLPVRRSPAAECHKFQGQLLAPGTLAIGVTALRGLAVCDRPHTAWVSVNEVVYCSAYNRVRVNLDKET